MKKTYLLLSFMLGSFGCSATAGCTQSSHDISTSVCTEDMMQLPLKDIARKYPHGNLQIGVAMNPTSLDTPSGIIAQREFGYITPENDFKQSYIHPVPDSWRWEKSDTWIDYAKKHGIIIRMHSPISPQCSKWVKNDARTGEELAPVMEDYLTKLCIRYANNSCVKWMDVVNETVSKNKIADKKYGTMECGDWFSSRIGDGTWENPWTRIGYDDKSEIKVPLYILRAFKICNQYAPQVKQIINQHGNFEAKVWDKIKKTVAYLRNNGCRVDGLGWQAHIDAGWEKTPGALERLDSFVTWCHDNNLEFHVTEMNVWLKEGTTEQEQEETYAAVIKTLSKHTHAGVIGICFWNIRDNETQHPDWKGCLWDKDGNPKPSYNRIKRELLNNL